MDILNTELQSQLIQLIQIIIGGCLSIASIYAVILINKYAFLLMRKSVFIHFKKFASVDFLHIFSHLLECALFKT